MTVVDFKKAKNTKQYPPEDFASLLEVFSGAYKIVNANLWFLWPYAVLLALITDGGIMPHNPWEVGKKMTGTFLHFVFGLTFLQLVFTTFATFLIVGFRRPCFSGLRGYIYDQRHKILTFVAIVCSYYALFMLSSVMIFTLVLLPLFFFFIEPICFFEDRSFFDIFKRSSRLMAGAKWPLLWVSLVYFIGTSIAMFIVVYIPTYILKGVFGSNGFISFVLSVLVSLAVGYIAMIFSTFKVALYLKRTKKVS